MKRLGPYTLERELSRGGMGVVYRARDPQLDRTVAIKVLLPAAFGQDHLDWARFQLEARTTAQLRHPNVVAIHSAGLDEGRPYLVLDLIEGGSLQERIEREGPLACREAARIARALADALCHAHEQGVLHRDLKPQNVLLEGGTRPLLADFGLGKLMGLERGGFTATGEIIGTPAYMAPEQAGAVHGLVGEATDIYGLGATLYAMLTGRPPFPGQDLVATLDAVIHRPPLAPSQLRRDLDPELEAICLRCLVKDPDSRYASAATLRSALDHYLEGPPAPRRRKAPDSPRRLRALGLLLCGALLGGGAVALWPASEGGLVGEALRLKRRGLERFQRDDFQGAEEDWSQVLAQAPDQAPTWYDRANARLGRKDYAGALADLERAASFQPADPESVHFLRSKVYAAQEDHAQAVAELDQALELRPDDALYYLSRGLSKEQLGDAEGALTDFARSLELDPRLAGSHYRRACVFVERGDYDATLAEVEATLAIQPDYPSAQAVRGMALAKQGQHQRSLEAYQAALRPGLKDLEKHLCNRASAFLQLGNWDGAAVDSGLVQDADPDWQEAWVLHAVARRAQGQLQERDGRRDQARRCYEDARRDFSEAARRSEQEQERQMFRQQIDGLDEALRRLGAAR